MDFREGEEGWNVGRMVMEISGYERSEVRGVGIEIVDGEGGKRGKKRVVGRYIRGEATIVVCVIEMKFGLS